MVFPSCLDLVSQDKGRVWHPRVQDLHLSAWRLSGIPSEHRDFLQTLPPWRPVPGEPTTYRTYDSRLSRFCQWCSEKEATPRSASLEQVSRFFKCLFDEGKQISTIKNYRSAIGAIHAGFPDRSTLGDNPILAQLVRGMSLARPVMRTLAPSWSINAVLEALVPPPPYEPMHEATLPDLTHKTLFLVAAASARRRSCLQALSMKPGHIRFEAHGVRLIPDPEFLPKNQTLVIT